MRVIFVRHGHPNYADDCLTPLGRLQAANAAKRLQDEGISEIYASTCGRAYETAQHTADLLGLPIVPCDFIREIRWASRDGTELYKNGNPWFISWDMAERGESLLHYDWQTREPFCHSQLVDCAAAVARDIDAWLLALGYRREGEGYRVVGDETNKTVAMFSHSGSSSAALAHITNLPLPYVCANIEPTFTAITILSFSDRPGVLTTPKFELINDARHIRGLVEGSSVDPR